MLDKKDLKIQVITILAEHDWNELCKILEEEFKINPNTANSLQICPDIIAILGDAINIIKKILMNQDEIHFKVLKQIYKALRNSVALNSDVQRLVFDSASILNDTVAILRFLKASCHELSIDCIKMLLQFLINLVINNELINNKVWIMFKNDLKELFKENICLYHTSALVYNIYHIDINLLRQDSEIIRYVFESYKQSSSNEYLTFLLELFIRDLELNKTYVNYNAKDRMLCLEMMKDLLDNDKSWVSEELLIILSYQFKHKSDCILKTVTDYLKQIEPFEVTLLLELLASISSDENYVKCLQKDRSLLINCAFLLKSIHSVGKESDNNFTAIPKLSQLEDSDLEIFQHPSYGFKASVIRLLTNLCWKNKQNQDEIRELDCIPILLDCCNIDARNPFIIQWVIFAIRNLCENNIENQAVIASMKKQGVVSSATLLEMGITLHSDEEHTIKIAPLNLNK